MEQVLKIFIEDAIRETLSVLRAQGYKIDNTRKYNTMYRALSQYCRDNCEGAYSIEIGEEFIEYLREKEPPLSAGYLQAYVCAVERVNHVMEGETDWHPHKNLLDYADSVFMSEARLYDEYLRNSGKTKSDVRGRMHYVARFLRFLDLSGVKHLTEITAKYVYEAFEQASDKSGFHRAITPFLKYAYRHGLTNDDLNLIVPLGTHHVGIPSVYTPVEVEKIIAAAGKSKQCGKRNLAIVLIAARLGLRSCDIVNLKFTNFYHERRTIELIQVKTGRPLVLPLLPEIRDAINDYVDNERPKCDNEHIFLYNAPPFGRTMQANNIYSTVSRIIDASGIDTKGRKRGAHALRSSLATALLDEGNSYHAIQEALGHKSPNATKYYAKTDVSHLRDYALPVPAPSGNFAAMLQTGVGA